VQVLQIDDKDRRPFPRLDPSPSITTLDIRVILAELHPTNSSAAKRSPPHRHSKSFCGLCKGFRRQEAAKLREAASAGSGRCGGRLGGGRGCLCLACGWAVELVSQVGERLLLELAHSFACQPELVADRGQRLRLIGEAEAKHDDSL
jgi:hypothetical protein